MLFNNNGNFSLWRCIFLGNEKSNRIDLLIIKPISMEIPFDSSFMLLRCILSSQLSTVLYILLEGYPMDGELANVRYSSSAWRKGQNLQIFSNFRRVVYGTIFLIYRVTFFKGGLLFFILQRRVFEVYLRTLYDTFFPYLLEVP